MQCYIYIKLYITVSAWSCRKPDSGGTSVRLLSLVILVAFCLVPLAAPAADTAISLREAMLLALERNHLVSGAAYEKEAAEHGAAASRSRYLPRILLDETFGVSNSPTRVFMMKLDQGRFSQGDFQ